MLYIILFLIVFGVAFYLTMRQYLLTPRYHYKERVMLLTIELHHRLDDAKFIINRTAQDKEDKKKAIQKDFGDRYLRSITVDALDEFGGIGPFIINKLKEENYKTLLDFTEPLHIRTFHHGRITLSSCARSLAALRMTARWTVIVLSIVTT